MVKVDLIVTRHPALVEYLQEIGIAGAETQVASHATPELIKGLHVAGVLPHALSCMTESFTEIPLTLPQELRGQELTLADMRQYAEEPVTYEIRKIAPERTNSKKGAQKKYSNDGEWLAADKCGYGYNQVRVSKGNIVYCPYQGEEEILRKNVENFSQDETREALAYFASICRGEKPCRKWMWISVEQ